jgi:hypothetical protein
MDKKQLIEAANHWVDEKKSVETINESETLVVLSTLATALFVGGGALAVAIDNFDNELGFTDAIKKSFNGIMKSVRYKSLNKAATALINTDEEVQQAFKAYTAAAKGQKLKSLKSFMDLIGTKLDTKHSGLLKKVIGDLKAEYNKMETKTETKY